MRLLFAALVFFPLFSIAQDCKILRETDPYTKETKISSGFITLQGASLTIDADSREIDYFFVVPGKCFNDQSTVFVYFEGTKSKATYRAASSQNCEGYFHFTFRNNATTTPFPVQKFGTQKVTQFVFTDSDRKQVIVTVQPDQQQIFMDATNCVVAEAKKLIK